MIEYLEQRTTDWAPVDAVESDFPKLHCMVARGDTIKADLIATMPAAIVSNERLFYFEAAATSDSTAHAIAGARSLLMKRYVVGRQR